MYIIFFKQYLFAVVNTVYVETILLNCFWEWNLEPLTFQDSVLTIKRNVPANFVYHLIEFIYTSHVWYLRKNNGEILVVEVIVETQIFDCKYFGNKKVKLFYLATFFT